MYILDFMFFAFQKDFRWFLSVLILDKRVNVVEPVFCFIKYILFNKRFSY